MAQMVRVRQVVTTVDAAAGTEMWTLDGPAVDGMVAGGYWEVVERKPAVDVVPVPRKSRKTEPEVVEDGGSDPA